MTGCAVTRSRGMAEVACCRRIDRAIAGHLEPPVTCQVTLWHDTVAQEFLMVGRSW